MGFEYQETSTKEASTTISPGQPTLTGERVIISPEPLGKILAWAIISSTLVLPALWSPTTTTWWSRRKGCTKYRFLKAVMNGTLSKNTFRRMWNVLRKQLKPSVWKIHAGQTWFGPHPGQVVLGVVVGVIVRQDVEDFRVQVNEGFLD